MAFWLQKEELSTGKLWITLLFVDNFWLVERESRGESREWSVVKSEEVRGEEVKGEIKNVSRETFI
jgi:hypothetical protein